MRVHQNIILNGVDMGDDPTRKNSKFCNEGKWNNFMKPLLPKDPQDMTFLEYGSNAGLYLKMASEYGFRDVYGLEHSNRVFRVAQKYRESLGMNYQLLHYYIDENFNYDLLPVSDISLLANFHYHLEIPVLRKLIDSLESKTCFCLVVSVETVREHPWRASGKRDETRSYFKYWERVGEVKPPSLEGDPHPRQMYSLLFKSPKLKRISLDEIKIRDLHHEHTISVVTDFVSQCLKDKNLDVTKTRYFSQELKRRYYKWPEERILQTLIAKRDLIYDIQKNGMKDPIILDNDNYIIDGNHRYYLLKILGYKSAIVRNL